MTNIYVNEYYKVGLEELVSCFLIIIKPCQFFINLKRSIIFCSRVAYKCFMVKIFCTQILSKNEHIKKYVIF